MPKEMFYFPAEKTVSSSTRKPVSLFGYVLLFLVLFSFVGMIGYVALISFLGYEIVFSNQSANLSNSTKTTNRPPAVVSPTPTPSPTPAIEISKLTSLDQVWNLYTNLALGYSMKIPKTSMSDAGKCVYVQKNDHSFRVFEDLVPVIALGNKNGVYITNEYFYEPSGETKENRISYFSACDKTIISSTLLDERRSQTGNIRKAMPANWLIETRSVSNEKELLQFIQDKYGKGCKLGAQKANDSGVLDVEIITDLKQKSLETSTCPINYKYALKYSPEKKLVATWGVGQDIKFSSPGNKPPYDQPMIDSFKFL